MSHGKQSSNMFTKTEKQTGPLDINSFELCTHNDFYRYVISECTWNVSKKTYSSRREQFKKWMMNSDLFLFSFSWKMILCRLDVWLIWTFLACVSVWAMSACWRRNYDFDGDPFQDQLNWRRRHVDFFFLNMLFSFMPLSIRIRCINILCRVIF